MNRSRDEFLAGAALARQQDRHVAVRDHLDQSVDALHRLAFAHHLVETRSGVEALPEVLVFRGQGVPLERLRDDDGETFAIDGLREVVVGAASHGLHGRVDGAVGGHDHHLRVRPGGLQPLKELHAAESRHSEVGQYQVRRRDGELLEGVLGRPRPANLIPLLLQEGDQGGSNIHLVVDDEDVGVHVHAPTPIGAPNPAAAGNCITTVVPSPGALDTRMRPPWSCMMRYAIARPSPVPLALVV